MAAGKERAQGIRMILKFDTGADGFLKMIYTLAITAGITLILGIYFLIYIFKDIVHTQY